MSFFHSLFAAIIPMLLYLLVFWRLDKYEREPFGKVIGHFLWGAFGAIFFGIIISTFFNATAKFFLSSPALLSFFGTVLVAPIVEEAVKAIYLLRTYRKNYFDNLTDGLVYGGAIGLGFGMTENLLYFSVYSETFEQWIIIVIIRSVFSAVMHAVATATFGAFLAKVKFGFYKQKYLLIFSGYLSAVIIHAAWNFSMSFELTYYPGIILMIIIIIIFLVIFSNSLKNEKRVIELNLKEEGINEKIYYCRRKRRFLLNRNSVKEINRMQERRIINFATKLAFRKLQAENSTGLQRDHYNSEVIKLRSVLNKLF